MLTPNEQYNRLGEALGAPAPMVCVDRQRPAGADPAREAWRARIAEAQAAQFAE